MTSRLYCLLSCSLLQSCVGTLPTISTTSTWCWLHINAGEVESNGLEVLHAPRSSSKTPQTILVLGERDRTSTSMLRRIQVSMRWSMPFVIAKWRRTGMVLVNVETC
ncbi:hypothetical protein KC19_1G210600 [Ceratodon purpureus]|uniref:Secreted protein n=1 Tax=Ceratodon purpureus TaxID=3225 RepID=A0A8T0J9V4_CERPU|nr:hypothetical protein KC19_1G210600 [Ceratodon purpureus]